MTDHPRNQVRCSSSTHLRLLMLGKSGPAEYEALHMQYNRCVDLLGRVGLQTPGHWGLRLC